VAFIDSLISDIAVAPPVDLLARWKADVAAEKAGIWTAP